ncbi:zinc phosphodiesterase ELAC protein 2 [Cyclospora cayetanensis]|uniref:ribonuclease Z n=1 Tax=Cyclospora cayetanensis TaxID=88456 RepID=A0A6P6RUX2_9EIME|nr:zinc phosphodiesterase ELAC protein 2 [Cyclospora cayetanensis]
MSITAQLLGTHRLAVAPSLHIFCEGPRLLINAGENVQRYHLEKKLHLHRISDIFLTSLSLSATAGLVGLLLSLEGTGAFAVTVWGPQGLRSMLQLAMKSFAGLTTLEINYRLLGPLEAPAALSGERFCTGGVCNGGCRHRSSIGGSSSRSKGLRTCACSYGPTVKGTASGVPVEAYFLPHSSRLLPQQRRETSTDNPLLSSPHSSSSMPNNSHSLSDDEAAAEAAATGAAAAAAEAWDAATKRRRLHSAGSSCLDFAGDEGTPQETARGSAAATPVGMRQKPTPAKTTLHNGYAESSDCLFLLLRCPTVRGRFFPEKAKALGIPPGPLYAQLKSGERVQLGDGRWIEPSQVCSDPQEGKAFAFVECLEPQQALKAVSLDSDGELEAPANKGARNRSWEETHPGAVANLRVQIKACGRLTCWTSHKGSFASTPFLHAARLNNLLHSLMPPLFPRRQQKEQTSLGDDHPATLAPPSLPCKPEALLEIEPLQKLWLSPPSRALLDEAPNKAQESHIGCFETLFEPATLKELQKAFARHLPTPDLLYEGQVPHGFGGPALKILGTGSAAPSHYRNVSATVLQLTPHLSMALDFGEGSLSQLRSATETEDEFLQILLSLQFVFISHCHADHHLGVLPLLQCRAALFPDAAPPVVIAPSRLQVWFAFAHKELAFIPHEFVCCDAFLSSLEDPFSTEHLPAITAVSWEGENAGLEIRTVSVDHIPESFGIRIDFKGVSVVYSGDTRPCPQLFALAKGCTALLHEATFEDGLLAEAIEKKHSCVSEVLEGATACGSESVILTHFSQRYPRVSERGNLLCKELTLVHRCGCGCLLQVSSSSGNCAIVRSTHRLLPSSFFPAVSLAPPPQIPHMPLNDRSSQAPFESGEGASTSEISIRKPSVLYAFDGIHLPLKHLSLVAPCFKLLPPVIEQVFSSLSEAANA